VHAEPAGLSPEVEMAGLRATDSMPLAPAHERPCLRTKRYDET